MPSASFSGSNTGVSVRIQGQLELLGLWGSIERRCGISPGVGAVPSVCLGRVWHTYAQGLGKSGEDFRGRLQLPFPFLSGWLLLSSQERKVKGGQWFLPLPKYTITRMGLNYNSSIEVTINNNIAGFVLIY